MSIMRCNTLHIPIFLLFILMFSPAFNLQVFAQIFNYDKRGNKIKASGEKVSIIINKKAGHDTRSGSAPISFPGIIASVISLGMNITKSIVSVEEEKYTASYTASKSENELIFLQNQHDSTSANLNIDSINIIRTLIGAEDKKIQACNIVLVPKVESNSGLFRFKVERLDIPFAKAKIKKSGNNGKLIDLSITIKMDAIWNEPGASSKQDSVSRGAVSKNKPSPDESFAQIKTATLGQATIIIPSVKPEGNFYLDEDYYSGWFQLIPAAALKFANAENNWKVGFYTLTITVKEANPYAVNSKKIADFFNATNTDIGTFLKQFFPVPSK